MPRLSGPGRVVSVFRPSPLRIELERAHDLLGEGAVLVDVRRHDDPDEPLEGAVRIPPDEIPASLERLRRDTPLLLACT